MNKYLEKLIKFIPLRPQPNNLNLFSEKEFKIISDKYLLDNITNHQKLSDIINSNIYWDNFKFDYNLGTMEIIGNSVNYALALDKQSVLQAEAMSKLNMMVTNYNNITLYIKVLINGSITVNLISSEFNIVLPCYSIKSL